MAAARAARSLATPVVSSAAAAAEDTGRSSLAPVLGAAIGLAAGFSASRRRPMHGRRVTRCAEEGKGGSTSSGKASDSRGLPPRKTVIITGASSGLGLAAATELARSGEWQVIMACRDFTKAERAAQKARLPKGSYKVLHLDLGAQKSVHQFVTSFRELGLPLDALVCNAAVYFPNAHKNGALIPGIFPGEGPRYSAEGHEMSFATNYLGHFMLTNLLLEDLKKSTNSPPRCVILGTVTASINDKEVGGMIPPIADVGKFEGLDQGMKLPRTSMVNGGEFDGAKAYKDSKVCEVMLMRELHRRYHKETGICFTSLYPGCIAETGLFREHYPVFRTLFPVFQKEVTKAFVSTAEAGKRLAQVVNDPDYAAASGSYFSWGGEDGTGGAGGEDAVDNTDRTGDRFLQYGSFRTLRSEEIGGEPGNDENCKKLWEASLQLCGL